MKNMICLIVVAKFIFLGPRPYYLVFTLTLANSTCKQEYGRIESYNEFLNLQFILCITKATITS